MTIALCRSCKRVVPRYSGVALASRAPNQQSTSPALVLSKKTQNIYTGNLAAKRNTAPQALRCPSFTVGSMRTEYAVSSLVSHSPSLVTHSPSQVTHPWSLALPSFPVHPQLFRRQHTKPKRAALGIASPQASGRFPGKLLQNWNSSGVVTFLETSLLRPYLAVPHIRVPSIKWVDWQALKAAGFEAVVMDKDNTITSPYSLTLHDSVAEAMEECLRCFPKKVAVISNSAGLFQYDPDDSIAVALESSLGIPVIRHTQKKPAGSASVLEKQLNCSARSTIFVGDRYFTDVVYGNRNGLLTIATSPLAPYLDPFMVQQIRPYEEELVNQWITSGIKAPLHPFLPGNPYKMIKDPGCW